MTRPSAAGDPALTLLLVEDDAPGRELATYNLQQAGYAVDAVPTGDEALARFSPERHAAVITDLRMPGISGMQVLRTIKQRASATPVIVITAYGNVDLAVEAMKEGAADFIGKPFNRDHLLLAVRRVLDQVALEAEVRQLRAQVRGVERPIIGTSAALRAVLDLVDRVAPSEATVLITGESGTGKELVARRLHARSQRAEGPLVAVNCAAVPHELLESELFGHEKGAFTGASRARRGRFRQADGGTIFLDEVAEIPLPLQAKLLRVLAERTVDVLGRDAPVAVDVRVVAATNQDIEAAVSRGAFREDLYYRLNVVGVHVPPLRERTEDIPPLVRHFVARYAEGRDLEVGDAVLNALRARPWPGNVRELENACERLVLLAPGRALRPEDLPPLPGGAPARPGAGDAPVPPSSADASGAASDIADWLQLPPEGLSLVELERTVIERVLAREQWNIAAAARYLRVPRHILTYRIEKHGIQRL